MKSLKVKYKTLMKYVYSLGYKQKRCRGSHFYYSNGIRTICIVRMSNHTTIGQGLIVGILRDLNQNMVNFKRYLNQ